LTSLANSKSASASDLAAAAGKISCSTIVPITNAGSVPVKVSVALAVTGDAVSVTKEADVDVENDGKYDNNVLLYAVPSAADTKDAAGYVKSTTGILMGKNEVSASFILPGAAYVFSKNKTGNATYVRDTSSAVHGTALKFEGRVAKNADWSEFSGTSATKSIGLTAVFTFTHTLGENDVAYETDGYPYGLMKLGTSSTIAVAADIAPSVTSDTDVTYSLASGADVTIDLGSGDLAATGIKSVGTVNAKATAAWAADTYELNGTTLTLKAGAASLSSLAVGATKTIKVTFNDTKATVVSLTVTIAD
jgi:hypothetical protein